MKKKFTIIIQKKGKTFFASCKEMPKVTAEAESKSAVLQEIKKAIIKKLGGDSDGGTSPQLAPTPPKPRGPNTLIELQEAPE